MRYAGAQSSAINNAEQMMKRRLIFIYMVYNDNNSSITKKKQNKCMRFRNFCAVILDNFYEKYKLNPQYLAFKNKRKINSEKFFYSFYYEQHYEVVLD